MVGRTVVVTGANSGLGRAVARALAGRGARVVLAVRTPEKGRAAAATMTGHVEVRSLDLPNLSAIRTFADELDQPIDVLVNSAGVMIRRSPVRPTDSNSSSEPTTWGTSR